MLGCEGMTSYSGRIHCLRIYPPKLTSISKILVGRCPQSDDRRPNEQLTEIPRSKNS